MDELLDGLHASLDGLTDPEARVRAFAAYHFEQVRTNRSVAEVLQVELRLSNKFLKEYRPEKLWAYLNVLREVIREGQASGRFRQDVDTFIAMWALFGALDELAMQWVLHRKNELFSLDQAARQVADLFIQGLLAAPSRPELEEP